MAGKIKGITVEIGGDTTKLSKAITEANKISKSLQSELKGVNSLLKMDPKNVTLLKQKEDLLNKSISETKSKLETLKKAMDGLTPEQIEADEEGYRDLQREIANTEQKLKSLEDQQKDFGSTGAQVIAGYGEKVKDLGEKFESVGKKMLPVTGAISAVGGIAVKTASNFDSSMSNVSAISGATGKDLDNLKKKARQMGSQTKYSASEAGDAMGYMAMAGWKTEDMLDGVEGVMNLASASGEDLATTSDIVTDALTGFGKSAEDSGKLADIMASASSNANTNVSLMGETFKYVASVAGTYGYSMEETAEMTALMANAGIKGSQAGTSLRSIMSRLATDAGASSKSLGALGTLTEKLGVEFYNADGSMRPFRDVINDTRGAWQNLTQEEQANYANKIAGKNAMSGWMALMNASEEDVTKLETALDNCDGTAENMANTMNDNLAGQFTILKSQLEELAISFGELLMPIIRSVVTWIQGVVDKLNSMSKTQRTIILIILAVVASIGPLLIAIGKVLSAVGTIMTWAPKIVTAVKTVITIAKSLWAVLMANPIVLIVALIAGLVAGLIYAYKHCDKFREAVNTAFAKVKEFVKSVVDSLCKFFTETIPNALNKMITWFKELPGKIWDALTKVVKKVTSWGSDMKNTASEKMEEVVKGIVNCFSNLPSKFIEIGKNIIGGIKSGIKSAVSGLYSGIKDALGGLVDKAKNALGIHSPSRVFADVIGKQIPAGIGVGVEDNTDLAEDAVGKLTDDITDQANAEILALNGATINRKLNTTFSGNMTVNNSRFYGTKLMEKLGDIYDRLDRMQIVLDTGILVGESVDPMDQALNDRNTKLVRGW